MRFEGDASPKYLSRLSRLAKPWSGGGSAVRRTKKHTVKHKTLAERFASSGGHATAPTCPLRAMCWAKESVRVVGFGHPAKTSGRWRLPRSALYYFPTPERRTDFTTTTTIGRHRCQTAALLQLQPSIGLVDGMANN